MSRAFSRASVNKLCRFRDHALKVYTKRARARTRIYMFSVATSELVIHTAYASCPVTYFFFPLFLLAKQANETGSASSTIAELFSKKKLLLRARVYLWVFVRAREREREAHLNAAAALEKSSSRL